MFDKLYTVVDGHCMYQGRSQELVPFLAEQQLVCPSYHNPADYCTYPKPNPNPSRELCRSHNIILFFISAVLEVAVGEHPRDLQSLIDAANKKFNQDTDQFSYMSNTDMSRLITTIKGSWMEMVRLFSKFTQYFSFHR